MGKVRGFLTKYGFPVDQLLLKDWRLQTSASQILELSACIDVNTSANSLRAHLVAEETGELLMGLAQGNRLEVLDALADLVYVTLGTAVAFGLPLREAFDEVHRSNMTKLLVEGRPGHPGKGLGYSPPNLEQFLS